MRPRNLNTVGDEPIYCETQHDDVFYSGSEDDYYEVPEHRRLRIEAKAVQFLNGSLPYLLSAKLKGPFDAKSWDNPWRSRRAQHQAVQLESQTRRSCTTVEAARCHGSGRATDDLPDTQRTSLYPLPSPETTNPPSTRKNTYIAEETYSRIKRWRQTVKRVPVSSDPFWASLPDKSQQSAATRKRSADRDWLHKRELKKRQSEDLSKSGPEESPSQAAAMARRNLLPDRVAEIVSQPAPGSFTHEDELAAQRGPNNENFNTSRMASMPTKNPAVLQIAHNSQSPARRLLAQDPESSEDELSMPSISPLVNTSRSPPKKCLSLAADRTPSRRSKRDTETASRARRCVDESKLDFDIGIPVGRGSAGDRATRLAKNASRRAVGVSQQDNSFCFHQAVPKSRSPRMNPAPARAQTDGTTLNHLSSQHGAPITANGDSDPEADQPCAEDSDSRAPAPADDQMDLDASDYQKPLPEVKDTALMSDEDTKMTDTGSLVTRARETQTTETMSVAKSRPEKAAEILGQTHDEGLQICINTEPNLHPHACTQELSPVSMQDNQQAAVASTTAAQYPLSTTCLTVDNDDASNSEWSTYTDTQDLPTASKRPSSFGEAPKDVEFVPQSVDDLDDPEWTTYVNTQEFTDYSTKNRTNSKDIDKVPVANHGTEDASDPGWSTLTNTQDPATVDTRCAQITVGVSFRMDPKPNDHSATESAVDATESTSEWSSHVKPSSPCDDDRTGNTARNPDLDEAPAPESKSSQVSLGFIVDAAAASNETHEEFEDCTESHLPIGDGTSPNNATKCQNDREIHGPEGSGLADRCSPMENSQGAPAPVAQMEQIDQPMERTEEPAFNFDGTTASFESPIPSADNAPLQSPWVKEDTDLSIPVSPRNDTLINESTSGLGLLAGHALAFSPALQTPWLGARLPNPDFSLSVKRFSDFMKPSPSKLRPSADRSILRSSGSTSRVLFGKPVPAKLKRRVTFAPLPGEEDAVLVAAESEEIGVYVEEDLSYFDAKGNKTASIHITRSQTRAASPPPINCNTTDADDMSDHDHRFARHFEAMSKRKKNAPKKMQRLLPPESQQTDDTQAIDAMAEAFIQASQTRKKSSELVEAIDDNSRLVQSSSHKTSSAIAVNSIEQQENIDPVDDVSAVLDNIDDFLDNSWGFDTSLKIGLEKETPSKQLAETIPSRFANVGDPMLAMHANVWAD